MSAVPSPAAKRPPEAPYQPLPIVLSAVAGGILVDRFRPLSVGTWCVAAALGVLLWAGATLGRRVKRRRLNLGQAFTGLGRRLSLRKVAAASSGRDEAANQRQDASATVQAFAERKATLCAPTAVRRLRPPPRVAALLAALVENALLLAAVAAMAAAWHHCRWDLTARDDLGLYAHGRPQPICLEGIALESPRTLPAAGMDALRPVAPELSSRLTLDLVALRNGAAWQSLGGRAVLLVPGDPPPIAAGDRLRCFAHLAAPDGPRNPGATGEAARLRADGIHSRLWTKDPACVSVVRPSEGPRPAKLFDCIRACGNRLLGDDLSPGCAEMAGAVLLGERDQVEYGLTENFMATGVIHLLVIAGLHIGILAAAVWWLVRRSPLGRGWAAALVASAALGYMLLVDAGPSVVRATVLVLVMCAAWYLGRHPVSFNSLAAAALIVLLLNPAHLFHAGAQLSFLSVAGIMWFAPRWRPGPPEPLERLLAANRPWPARLGWASVRSLRHLFVVSTVIWLLTIPLVMARFHLLTPVAILLNTVLWIPMACGLLSGALLLTIGAVVPPVAWLCGRGCELSFGFIEWCVAAAQQLPGSHFWVPGPPDWWLWGFYGGLGLLAAFPRLRPPRRWCAGLLAGWVLAGFAAAHRHDSQSLDCTFLSVGHGLSVLVELPSGQALLYDAGQNDAPRAAARAISESLWSLGRRHIDAVVLSHPDLDHYDAVPELLDKFSVGAVYVSSIMFDKVNPAMKELRRAIDEHHVPVREIQAGDRFSGGGDCRIEVLHPSDEIPLGLRSANADSIVLAVTYRGRRILLTGDLESPGLDDLLAEEPLRCDVLMAPHHGSRKSNSPALARWCRPRWVVFSDDGHLNTPEIDRGYQSLGGQTLHTWNSGAVHVRIAPEGIEVAPTIIPSPSKERAG
jgi:competence protein ComEC